MNDADLAIVLAELRRKHPQLFTHLKTLAAQHGTPVAAAATAVLDTLLSEFDRAEQAQWQLRDVLKKVPTADGFYYALKYNAQELVYRIASAGGLGLLNVTFFQDKQPPEIANWKSDHD